MKNRIFIILGWLSFGVGVLGIFLPILPTTPFLLLAAFLFSKGSGKPYNWLVNHKFFGEYIRNFQETKTIPLGTKISSISTLWIVMLGSVFFVVNGRWYLQLLLILVSIAVTIHILSFKTKKI